MKRIIYVALLCLLLFSSCKSRRNLVSPLPRLDIQTDTLQASDTLGLPASLSPLLTFDQSDLRHIRRPVGRPAVQTPKPQPVVVTPPHIVKRGTRITTSVRDVSSAYKGVKRVKTYEFTHRDVPAAFEGCRIAFISDLHYKSLLDEKGLKGLVRLLTDLKPDALLIGGDLHEGCQYVSPLLSALVQVRPPLGIYSVLGNNDYEACYDEIVSEMERLDIHLLEHKVDTLRRDGEQILVAGVRNPFNLKRNGQSPTLALSPSDFVILLTHTPDYVEDVPVTNTDLALAGHTHGGQVTLFGYAPVINSHYGQRFVSGLKYNSSHIPLIITNGIGTSKQAIRLFAPAEVVMIVLHRLTD